MNHAGLQDPRLWARAAIRREVIERDGLGPLLTNPRLVLYCTVLYCTVLLTNPRLGLVTDLDLSYLDLTQESRRSLAAAVRRFRRIWMRFASLDRGMLSPCRHVAMSPGTAT